MDLIRDHYDRLSVFYRALWGEHLHHGYWEDGESGSHRGQPAMGTQSPAAAQVKLVERLAERVGVLRGSRVLDVGCGLGGSSLWLAREFDCSVLGITISPVQAAMAREKASAEGLNGRVRFEVADANHLDLTPESFDVVWVIECSEHLTDKERFIAQCGRVLKPDGVLALCAWLATEKSDSPAHGHLVADVCRGMLCPQLVVHHDERDG
ncbi:MAG: methyltransferase domain-containing protein [Acidobacteria bacterium]|nr:methyltransferase domain-containing protein [Acidobacteriota bacterium]